MTRSITSTALLVGATCLVAVMTTTQLGAATNTLIMSGLNNPRGLALGPDGGIYVAEAGAGGTGQCQLTSANENHCFGLTGAISRFLNGVQQRVVAELPSHALPGGDGAGGPSDVGFQGSTMFVTFGLGLDPSSRARSWNGYRGNMFGTLQQISRTGEMTEVGDVAAYERDVNPAGGPLDSNPFGLLVLPTLRIVTDAEGTPYSPSLRAAWSTRSRCFRRVPAGRLMPCRPRSRWDQMARITSASCLACRSLPAQPTFTGSCQARLLRSSEADSRR